MHTNMYRIKSIRMLEIQTILRVMVVDYLSVNDERVPPVN